jgi:hypothetical protein
MLEAREKKLELCISTEVAGSDKQLEMIMTHATEQQTDNYARSLLRGRGVDSNVDDHFRWCKSCRTRLDATLVLIEALRLAYEQSWSTLPSVTTGRKCRKRYAQRAEPMVTGLESVPRALRMR